MKVSLNIFCEGYNSVTVVAPFVKKPRSQIRLRIQAFSFGSEFRLLFIVVDPDPESGMNIPDLIFENLVR